MQILTLLESRGMIKLKPMIKEVVYPNNSAKIVDMLRQQALAKSVDEFTAEYIATALWSSADAFSYNHGERNNWDTEYDEDEPSGVSEPQPEPLDKNYTVDDIEDSTFMKMVDDCEDFQRKYHELYERGGWSDEQAGMDFWLTRNRHGAGFWDRSYKQPEKEIIGEELTKMAHSYGEFNLYLGDGKYDGLICGTNG